MFCKELYDSCDLNTHRKFEPDPARFTSIEEIETCETHLMDTLIRVFQRRVTHTTHNSCSAIKTTYTVRGEKN